MCENSSGQKETVPEKRDHYLKEELYRLVREDPLIFDFSRMALWTGSGIGTLRIRKTSG